MRSLIAILFLILSLTGVFGQTQRAVQYNPTTRITSPTNVVYYGEFSVFRTNESGTIGWFPLQLNVFNSMPLEATSIPLLRSGSRFTWGAYWPNGNSVPVTHGAWKSPSTSGDQTVARDASATNSIFGQWMPSGGATSDGRISCTDLFMCLSNTPFHFSVCVGFSNSLGTNVLRVDLAPPSLLSYGDIGAYCGWWAENRGSKQTNWVAGYWNGSTFVNVHTNSAKTGRPHILDVYNPDGTKIVWAMDGVPVYTNSDSTTVAGTGQGAFLVERVTTTAGTNHIMWQYMQCVWKPTMQNVDF